MYKCERFSSTNAEGRHEATAGDRALGIPGGGQDDAPQSRAREPRGPASRGDRERHERGEHRRGSRAQRGRAPRSRRGAPRRDDERVHLLHPAGRPPAGGRAARPGGPLRLPADRIDRDLRTAAGGTDLHLHGRGGPNPRGPRPSGHDGHRGRRGGLRQRLQRSRGPREPRARDRRRGSAHDRRSARRAGGVRRRRGGVQGRPRGRRGHAGGRGHDPRAQSERPDHPCRPRAGRPVRDPRHRALRHGRRTGIGGVDQGAAGRAHARDGGVRDPQFRLPGAPAVPSGEVPPDDANRRLGRRHPLQGLLLGREPAALGLSLVAGRWRGALRGHGTVVGRRAGRGVAGGRGSDRENR